MLVLSRKLGEKIYINGNISIEIVDIDRGKVRLGISAPKEVPIDREEVWEKRKDKPGATIAPPSEAVTTE